MDFKRFQSAFILFLLLSFSTETEAQQTNCGWGATTSVRRDVKGGDPAAASGVTDPDRAVGGDKATYSTINVQVPKKGEATISQTIYFSNPAGASDLLRLYFSDSQQVSRNTVQATAQAFLNNAAVSGPVDIFSQVQQSGSMQSVEIAPGGSFDRVTISITVSSTAPNGYALNLHESSIVLGSPVFNSTSTGFCQGTTETISVANPVAGVQYNWYDQDDNSLQRSTAASYTPPTNLPAGLHTLKVTASPPGCLEESVPATITVDIYPKPQLPEIKPLNN
jgi:large repetitive protein